MRCTKAGNTGCSDCNMQEGHLRMDANISVRLKGEKELRPKAEIKVKGSICFI